MASNSTSATPNMTTAAVNVSQSQHPSTTTSPYVVPMKYYDSARYIYFYGLAVILPVGLLCNLLCFAVFLSSRSLRKTTTGHYLMALAVADNTFLVGELFRWLNSFDRHGQILGIDFMETITFWCRTTFFLRYAGKLASAWITVVISAERFITVAYPLRVALISTPKTAKISIVCVYVLCCCFGAYPFWTIGLKQGNGSTYCGIVHPVAYENWSMAVLRIGSLLLPSAIIFVLTILLLVCLYRARRRRLLELVAACNTRHPRHHHLARSADVQLTVMLVSVAIVFLLLRLPYTISFYLNEYKEQIWRPIDPWFTFGIYRANKICDLIAISNYAVNFFLYCLCGSAVRERLLRCPGTKPRRTFMPARPVKSASSSPRTKSTKL